MLRFTAIVPAVLAVVLIVASGCSSQPELQWNEAEGYRWAELRPGGSSQAGFKLLGSSRTGVTFRNDLREDLARENRHYLNGSGVAAGDVDGDGLVDLYFSRLDGPNKLYKNLGGFRFQDVTEQAGVALEEHNSTGTTFADVDGDGDLDLLVTSLSTGNVLFLNDGQGRFTRKEDSGLGESKGAMTMTLADVDADGLLDLYITNYKVQTARDLFGPQELALERTVEVRDGVMRVLPPYDQYFTIIEAGGKPYRNEYGEKDELYLNRGNGTFERVDDTQYFFDEHGSPKGLARDWGLSATFRDVNGDGHPDLYVANDFWTPDRFWINRGDGTFRAVGARALPNMSFSSMGVDFSDINRDGHVDFVVTEMLSTDHRTRMRQFSEQLEAYEGQTQYNRNSVYLNRGDTTFAQIAYYSGLQASDWSWATYFMDIDLDGFEDLIVATGFANDYLDIDTQIAMGEQDRGMVRTGSSVLEYPSLKLTNKIFRNNGDLTFTDVSEQWGFDVEDYAHGMALADLNNDGTLDLVINRLNDEAAIYQNRTGAPRIAVRLNGNVPNTEGIGARVELTGGPVAQSKEIIAGGNYLSGSQAQVVFAADEDNPNHVLTVVWPSGKQSRIEGVQANRIYVIDESAAREVDAPAPNVDPPTPLLADVSERIGHRHQENVYDDFRFSPLLPLKLSRLGPGVAWIDYDGDGDDDLLIGSGRDGRLAVFENRGDGRFRSVALGSLTQPAPGDQTAIVGWREGNRTKLVVGSANYEQGRPDAPSAFLYTIHPDGTVEAVPFPGVLSTTGPIAAADYTGDGYIDVFIGGRFKPGQYPRDAESRLFKNVDGTFQLDEENTRTFSELGLVTGATFADFNQDGRPDLLISTEWGTLRLFENDEGIFRDVTARVGLDAYSGWWNGVATGDFNNDGRPDIIATNLGTNSPYQTGPRPLKMYYGDFNRNGRLQIVEAYYDEDIKAYVPMRKLNDLGAMSRVLAAVRSHREFAGASVQKLFGIDAGVPAKEINTLQHTLFINTGEGFEARPLPPEAQFTAAFHAGVADFDNDGNEDLFLSQNLFAFAPHISRLDAGRGLLLRGDGKGNLTPVSSSESGIEINGEQRGAALGDFDRDGRVDLAVSQNDGQTKLYLNETVRRGLRVRLIGPESNRNAVGSSLRIVYRDGSKGPRRAIQAGTGYWSQNSAIQVMGTSGEPIQIEVTWFDGTVETVETQPGVDEYEITYRGGGWPVTGPASS